MLPSEEPPTKLQEGDKIRFFVELPMAAGPDPKRQSTTTDELVELISTPADSDAPKLFKANWSMVQTMLVPSFVLRCLRCSEVEVLGDAECDFRSWETFNGLSAWVVKMTAGAAVQRGFEEWGEGLKKAAEERWKSQKG